MRKQRLTRASCTEHKEWSPAFVIIITSLGHSDIGQQLVALDSLDFSPHNLCTGLNKYNRLSKVQMQGKIRKYLQLLLFTITLSSFAIFLAVVFSTDFSSQRFPGNTPPTLTSRATRILPAPAGG